jgi:hypothetical protein
VLLHAQPHYCFLLQHQLARGQLVNLFRIALEDTVDPAIRQIAAISFKNTAKKSWEGSGKSLHWVTYPFT